MNRKRTFEDTASSSQDASMSPQKRRRLRTERPVLPYDTRPNPAFSAPSRNTAPVAGTSSWATFKFRLEVPPVARAARAQRRAPDAFRGNLTVPDATAASDATAAPEIFATGTNDATFAASIASTDAVNEQAAVSEHDGSDVLFVQVSAAVDAISFQELPLEFMNIELLSIALHAHHISRSGPRTQQRYLHLATKHRCTSLCRDIRFSLSAERRHMQDIDYDRLLALCERLMSAGEPEEDFPPGRDENLRLDVIRRWLDFFSDGELELKTCASCSALVLRCNSAQRTLGSEHLSVLTNPGLPDHIFPVGYDRRLVGDAMLDAAGIVTCSPDCVVVVCNSCWSNLRLLRLPPLSLANDNYFGWDNLPSNIKELFSMATPMELSLIGRNRVRCTIYKFTASPGSGDDDTGVPAFYHPQYYTKGNVISFTNGNVDLLDVLPPAPDQLEATVSVIFVGKILPPPEELDRLTPLLVRRHVVVPLLKWLVANHPDYHGVEYSATNMDSLLPDKSEGAPVGLRMQLVTQSGTEDPTASTVPSEDIDLPDISQIPFGSAGVVNRTFDSQTIQQQKLAAMLMWKRKGATAWAIGHGESPVPEWDNPSYYTRLFPKLFPFGIGAPNDSTRRVPIAYEEHVRHLLNLSSRRFATDHVFQYVAMNIAQRKRVRQGIRWQVSRSFWQPAHDFLANVDVEVIKRIAERADKNRGHVRPQDDAEKKVVDFMNMLKNVPVNVPGTPSAKKRMRNEIRATIHHRGLPALFITLNPADMYHPLFLKLLGLAICLDERRQTDYPSAYRRAFLVAKNPTAAAQFFNTMFTAFVDIVLGMKYGGKGLFGKVTAYYATVEAQGRGSLHGHVVVWIDGSLPPQMLRDRMESDEEFKFRLFGWLESIISSHLPGMSTVIARSEATRVVRPKGTPHSSTMKCPHPDDPDFEAEWLRQSVQVTYESHYHTHNATCWKYLKAGQPRDPALCRMRMNGETRPRTEVDKASGSILLRRWHPDINQHNPTLSMLARCNNDVKFIGSGAAAKALTYYITDYITKDNLPTDEAFCALSKLVDRIQDPANHDFASVVGSAKQYDVQEHGARFLTRACNALLACREVSAQEVALFFHKSGSSDHYCSETYVTILWGSLIRWVIRQELCTGAGAAVEVGAADPKESLASSPGEGEDVEFNGVKRVPSTQLDDYRFRGRELDHLGIYWFFACTSTVSAKSEDHRVSTRLNSTSRASMRVPFLPAHPNHVGKTVRMRERAAVPTLVGPTLPRADRPDQYADYCRAMLVLFKPWREWSDLRQPGQTWPQAFEAYAFDGNSRRIMRNFAAAHECKDASDAYRELRRSGVIAHDIVGAEVFDKALATSRHETDENLADWLNENHPGLVGYVGGPDLDSEGEYIVRDEEEEIVMSKISMEKAKRLRDDVQRVVAFVTPKTRSGDLSEIVDVAEKQSKDTIADITMYKAQTARLKKELPMWVDQDGDGDVPDESEDQERVHQWLHDPERVRVMRPPDSSVDSADIPGVMRDVVRKFNFNAEQRAAFGIVAGHRLAESAEQLLMFVVGGGGTGKSHIVRGWDEFFALIGALEELKKSAPTGIASYLIRAETMHALLKLHLKQVSGPTLELLQATWRCVRYLVIDEVSMVGARMLAEVSQRLQLIFGNDLPFGGLNVIFIGDPRQLPPVGDKAPWSEPGPKDPSTLTVKGQLLAYGRSLWRRLTHVVVLKQNYRQRDDPMYQQIVTRVGDGLASDVDCSLLRRRQLGVAQFTPDFVDVPLITANKTVRDAWNEHAVRAFADRTGQEYFEYVAVDRAQGRLLTGRNRERILAKSSSETVDRLSRLPLVAKMRVMVLTNLVTRGGIVNGAEGTVERIIYSEAPTGERYLLCVLVRVEGSILQYPGLEAGVVPIFPDSKYFKVRRRDQSTMTVSRWQVPLLPAYAYTDYKSQGRTLLYAILDLASAKRRESVYVMLSRVVSMRNVLILRRFPNRQIVSPLAIESARTLEVLRLQDIATVQAWIDSPVEQFLRVDTT